MGKPNKHAHNFQMSKILRHYNIKQFCDVCAVKNDTPLLFIYQKLITNQGS